MKYFKIITVNFFIVLLFAGLYNPAFAFDAFVVTDSKKSSFSDVYMHNIYFESVEVLFKNNVVQGYSDGTFQPEKKVNRAEFLKIIMEVKGLKAEGSGCFKDVKKEWYAKYVCKAKKQGIIKGYSDGKFYPERNISFVEAAKIITEAYGKTVDKQYNKNWYHPYVKIFEENVSIPVSITGFSHQITRGEMAKMSVDMSVGRGGYTTLTYEDLEKFGAYATVDKDKKIFSHVFKKLYNGEISTSDVPSTINLHSFSSPDALDTWAHIKIYRDNSNVYCYVSDATKSLLVPIQGADSKTFNSLYNNDKKFAFATDKQHSYLLNKDKTCYEKADDIIGSKKYFYSTIFTDEENVYYYDLSSKGDKEFVKIEGADPKTFKDYNKIKLLSQMFYEDKNNLYLYNGKTVLKLDVDKSSFQKSDAKLLSGKNNWSYFTVYHDKNNVYYFDLGMTYMWKINGADPATFKFSYEGDNRILAQDKNAAYHIDILGNLIVNKDIDMSTFARVKTKGAELTNTYYLKDKNNVYRVSDLTRITWADPNKFEVNEYNIGFYVYFVYGKSKNDFWYYDEITKKEIIFNQIDADTFEVLEKMSKTTDVPGYGDPTDIYTDIGYCKKLEEDYKNPSTPFKTFKMLNNGTCNVTTEVGGMDSYRTSTDGIVMSDKNNVWRYYVRLYKLEKISNLDGGTFKQLGTDVFVDKNGIYVLTNVFLEKSESEYDFMLKSDNSFIKQQGITDIATFVAVEKGESIFFKDKNNVYYNNSGLTKLIDADPVTFAIVSSNAGETGFVKDKNSVWKEDVAEKVYKKIKGADPKTYFFGKVNDDERKSEMGTILSAVYQYQTSPIARGALPQCLLGASPVATAIPECDTDGSGVGIGNGGFEGAVQLGTPGTATTYDCSTTLLPNYLRSMPIDPTPTYTAAATGYYMCQDTSGAVNKVYVISNGAEVYTADGGCEKPGTTTVTMCVSG